MEIQKNMSIEEASLYATSLEDQRDQLASILREAAELDGFDDMGTKASWLDRADELLNQLEESK